MRRSIHRRGLSTTHIVLIVVGVVLVTSCLAVVVLSSLLLPALAKARDGAKAAKSTYQVRLIIQGIDQYQRDHSGQPPVSMQALADSGLIPPGIDASPFGPAADGRGDYWIDFTLGGAQGSKDTSGLIVCVDRAMLATTRPRPRIVVGYADGHAAELDRAAVEQFMRTMASGPPSAQPATSR